VFFLLISKPLFPEYKADHQHCILILIILTRLQWKTPEPYNQNSSLWGGVLCILPSECLPELRSDAGILLTAFYKAVQVCWGADN